MLILTVMLAERGRLYPRNYLRRDVFYELASSGGNEPGDFIEPKK
jgi:hypothetical protein